MEAITAKKKSTSKKKGQPKKKSKRTPGPETLLFADWENVFIQAQEYGLWLNAVKAYKYFRFLGAQVQHFYCVNHRRASKGSTAQGIVASMLRDQGAQVTEKRVRRGYFKKQSQLRRSANLDVDLTIGATDGMRHGSVKKIMLISGDGDFTSLVARIQSHRKKNPIKVVVIGWRENTALDLMQQADEFLPIDGVVSRMTSRWPDWMNWVPQPDEYAGPTAQLVQQP